MLYIIVSIIIGIAQFYASSCHLKKLMGTDVKIFNRAITPFGVKVMAAFDAVAMTAVVLTILNVM